MKAILMSIHPKWCEKIFNGSKTIYYSEEKREAAEARLAELKGERFMREILFRGKAKANDCCKGGYWVYGDVAHIGDIVCISVGKGRDNVEVIPETVGQYTGLTDKNGI